MDPKAPMIKTTAVHHLNFVRKGMIKCMMMTKMEQMRYFYSGKYLASSLILWPRSRVFLIDVD